MCEITLIEGSCLDNAFETYGNASFKFKTSFVYVGRRVDSVPSMIRHAKEMLPFCFL